MRCSAEVFLQSDRTLRRLGLGERSERAQRWAEELQRAAEPFTPRRTGKLIRSAAVTPASGGAWLRYPVPYAARVYRGQAASGRPLCYTGAPQRGPNWIKKTLAAGWQPEKGGEI